MAISTPPPSRFADFLESLVSLLEPDSWLGAAVLLGCLALAWLAVKLLRSVDSPPDSVWLGRSSIDGLLFPTLALCLAYVGRMALAGLGLSVAVFKLVIPLLLALAVIRLSVRVLSAAFPASKLMRWAERTISWMVWLGLVGWVTGVLPQMLDELDQIQWKLGNTHVSVRNLIEGGLSAGFVMMLALWVSAALEARLLRGASGEQLSLRKAAANSLRALLLLVSLLMALSAAGIDLTALSVLGGAVGVGLGFGLQKLAANYVSGFVILAERSLRIGDIVKIGQFEGSITDITTRYTVLRASTGTESIIPNELLITQPVENLSLADRDIRLSTRVAVAYGTDLTALFPRLEACVGAVPRVVSVPPPQLFLEAFGADGLELSVGFWISDPENGQGNVRSAVNLALLAQLNELGIDIPYPQRVVHAAPALQPPLAAPRST